MFAKIFRKFFREFSMGISMSFYKGSGTGAILAPVKILNV